MNKNHYEEKKRRIVNDLHEIFILNANNIDNYKEANPINLIIINTNYVFENNFLEIIINGKQKNNVKKIITSDLVITKYFGKILKDFEYLFPSCDTIQVNTFDNNCEKISRIIDCLGVVKNLEYILDDHIFINYEFRNLYWFFIGSLLNGFLVNIKNIILRNKVDTDNFNDFITNKITKFDIINKNNLYVLNFLIKNKFENFCFQNNVIESNKYINLVNFKFIDFYGNIMLDGNLININQITIFEKYEIM